VKAPTLTAALLSAAFLLVACSSPRPAARVGFDAAGSPQIEQTGPVLEPARVATDETTVTLAIPAGSTIVIADAVSWPSDPRAISDAARLAPDLTLIDRQPAAAPEVTRFAIVTSQPTELRAHRRAVLISGPKSYAPPSGPSPSEKAAGKAAWLYRFGLVGGLALAGLGIWWKGPLIIAGGVSVAGASAFGWFVEDNPWALRVFGVGVGLAAFGFALWHLWLKKRQGLIAK
jgi:hypothetical protein